MNTARHSRTCAYERSVVIRWWDRVGLTLLLAVAAFGAAARGAPQVWTGHVTHVSDGDTIWVRPDLGGAPRSVRLDGIDAPERCQRYGETARAALDARIGGRHVQVRVRRHDAHGRALATVRLQGVDVGAWMVSHGHAWSYRYRGQPGPYAQQEAQARAGRRGLFGEPGRLETPRAFRRRHGPCRSGR